MAAVAPEPTPAEPRRFSIRLPRPMWIGLATVLLIGAAIFVRVGLPIYRQHLAIREIERLGGYVETRPRGPEWLRDWVGNERFRLCEDVDLVRVDRPTVAVTEATLAHVSW